MRTALLQADLSPHNGQAKTVNCKGVGTCGTCALKITQGDVAPKERGLKENVRLNVPPAFSAVEQTQYEGTQDLRLACQVKVFGDIEIEKYDGLWGQKVGIPSTTLNEGANIFAALDIEYIMDNDSIMDQKLEVKERKIVMEETKD